MIIDTNKMVGVIMLNRNIRRTGSIDSKRRITRGIWRIRNLNKHMINSIMIVVMSKSMDMIRINRSLSINNNMNKWSQSPYYEYE